MKNLLTAALLFTLSAGTVRAQQPYTAEAFKKHKGKTGILCDTVSSLHIVNDTLVYLYMDKAFPNQKYTVAIRGNKINLDWTTLKNKVICVSGVFEYDKGEPRIDVAEPDRIRVQ